MNTRAVITVFDDTVQVRYNQQFDGYPEGVVPYIEKFLEYVKDGRIRDNAEQAAGWLPMMANCEWAHTYIELGKKEPKFYKGMRYKPCEPGDKDNSIGWKVGHLEPVGEGVEIVDDKWRYGIDLTNKTYSIWERTDWTPPKYEQVTYADYLKAQQKTNPRRRLLRKARRHREMSELVRTAKRARGGTPLLPPPHRSPSGTTIASSAPAAQTQENPAYRGHVGIYAEQVLPKAGGYDITAVALAAPLSGETEPGVPSGAAMTTRKEVPLVAENAPLSNLLECPNDGERLTFYGMGDTDKEKGVMVYRCSKCNRTYRKKR